MISPNDIHVNNFQATQLAAAQNDCDESGAGNNEANCENIDGTNDIDGITQLNEITTADSAAQVNNATLFQALDLLNNCDESGEWS